MRRAIVAILGVLAFGAGIAQAQDLTGQWQGTLQAARDLRTVIRISKGDDGALRAVLYSIDQGAQGLSATVAVQGTSVTITVPGINATFEGKLTPDGNTIAGTMSQGPGKLPLTLTRASGDAAWAIPQAPPALKPMPADANPKIAASTVKPSNPDQPGKLFTVRGRNLVTVNTTVADLIAFGYSVHPKQITAGPAWIESDKYDLTVQPDVDGLPNERQLRSLIQQVLADRFHLTLHRDKKELSAYALILGKDGPKLTRSSGDPNGLPGLFFRGLGVLPATNANMDNFADLLQAAVLDRPVVNKTGLTGRYDFTLKWTPEEGQFASLGARIPPPSGDPDAPPGLFTAIQEQLGLKLDAVKTPVEVLVLDRLEKPSEN